MGWVTRALKIPDDKPWIAMVVIDSDGSNDILGYINLGTWQEFVSTSKQLESMMMDWLHQGVKSE